MVADKSPKTLARPSCGRPVPWVPESKWRPFCNERCRLIDLGEWLGEEYRLSESTEDNNVPPTQ